MVDYLTDLDVNQNKDVHLDSANDLALTSGRANLEQGIGLSTMTITSSVLGGRATAENLGLLEQRVAEYLDEDPHVGEVLNVQTQTVNRQSGVVTMRIELVENDSFEIEVTE